MTDMADVLRNTMLDHRVLWEIGLDDKCELIAKCQSCGYLSTELETWEHQSNVAAEALSTAGFGPVQEARAEAWDEGYRLGQLVEPAQNPYRKASDDGS